jgi:hypothetical protein
MCIYTGVVSFIVLFYFLKVQREVHIEELEQMQISSALADGKTPQELASEGYSSAIQPKVLK